MKNFYNKRIFPPKNTIRWILVGCALAIGYCFISTKNVMAQGGNWQSNGNNITYTNREFVGINTNVPNKALHIMSFHYDTIFISQPHPGRPPKETATHSGIRLEDNIVELTVQAPSPFPFTTGGSSSIWDLYSVADPINILPLFQKFHIGNPLFTVPVITLTQHGIVSNRGNMGINDTTPNTTLSISSSELGAKITLWDGNSLTDHYGFGISNQKSVDTVLMVQVVTRKLNYHVGEVSGAHVFYAGGKNGDDGNSTELMRVKGNGQVLMGTSTIPSGFSSERLYVAGGNILLDKDFYLKSKRDGHIVNLIGVTEGLPLPPTSTPGPTASIITIGESTTIPAEVRIYTPTDNNQGVSIYNDQTRLVFFRNDGFVDVAGTLRACELIVDLTSGGCDYVLEEGYKKDELDYVRDFTEKYNHLPGVQSAKEMIKEGLNVSNMFTTLLKKIEEIFLHLFDLDNAIKGLSNAVDNLFNKDQALEKRIVELEKQNEELIDNVDMLVKRVEDLE